MFSTRVHSVCALALLFALAGSYPADAAQLRSLQSGSATIADLASSTTVALPQTVTASQSFLVFSLSVSANEPQNGGVSGRLTGAGNQVVFDRVGTSGSVAIEWYVAEFATGVTVQRGTADLTLGIPFNQPIAAVNPARSFPIVSHRAGGTNINANDFVKAKITGGGANLELSYLCCGTSITPEVAEWQVIEYQDSLVKTGDVVFTDVDTVRTAPLAPAVNTAKSWLLFTYRCDVDCPSTTDVGSKMLRGRVTNGATLTFDRSVTAANEGLALTWYLVEFTDQTIVRSGTTNFAAADSQRGAVFAPVTQEASIVTAGGAYHRGGRTSFTADDNIGVGSVSLDLATPTNLVLRRGATGAPADIGWYVVSFVNTQFRSIGTLGNYAVNTVSVTQGSNVVTGSGTAWMTANRGRGDRININGTNYTVYAVDSETQLRLTNPYTGATNGARPYTIFRQFATLASWEDCVDGGTACGAFPAWPVGGNLVSDGRSEVGIAYEETPLAGGLVIDGSVTDAMHTITLTADGGNRHYGKSGQGVTINNGASAMPAVRVRDDFVTVEWMEVTGGNGVAADGIEVSGLAAASQVVIRQNLVQTVTGSGIDVIEDDSRVDLYNNFIYDAGRRGIRFSSAVLLASSRFRVLNNTIFRSQLDGISKIAGGSAATLLLRNNLSHGNLGADYAADPVDSVAAASSGNLSEDGTATTHSPGGGAHPNIPLTGAAGTAVNFVSTAAPVNLHLQGTSYAIDKAASLSSIFTNDIDNGQRQSPWDIGADDVAAVTAVTLVSFEAQGHDSSVALSWETASEVDNLGFHLYRSLAAAGPYSRITTFLIPGLGSSPVGARYRFTDSEVSNGTTYFYRLEDIETTGETEEHGPVSATPMEEAGLEPSVSAAAIEYGTPTSGATLRVLERSPRAMVLELSTDGFEAQVADDGTVRLSIPGFEVPGEPGLPALPVKRSWVDIEAGRGARLASVRAVQVEAFSSMRLSAADAPVVEASSQGTVQAGRRISPEAIAFRRPGLYPREAARLLEQGYQGEAAKALLELAPLRWDRTTGRLLLARRLIVRLVFAGSDPISHRETSSHRRSRPALRLAVREKGLYRVRFEETLGARPAPLSSLRLSRQGKPVPFHLEPDNGVFGRGSSLFFWSEGAELNPHGTEVVYELERSSGGLPMARGPAASTSGSPNVEFYRHVVKREENRLYQAALLEAPDPWLWDVLFAPIEKQYPFEVSDLAPSPAPTRLSLRLQGQSDFPASPDHHVRVSVNGIPVAEGWLDGKSPSSIEALVPAGALLEGENRLAIENAGDTEAPYSMVMLDGFEIDYPRRIPSAASWFEGTFSESGEAEIGGLFEARALDVTESSPKWLALLATDRGAKLSVEAGRSYVAVSSSQIGRPEIRSIPEARLKAEGNRADYLMVGPRELLAAARPLLELRRRQGLTSRAVALEDIDSEFGFGESHPEAIREFLSYAYHHWRKPAPRYVLLVGDATYDFKDYLGTGVTNRVPPMIEKTSYLWTASDAAYASVHGEDPLPDFAIGRLSAGNIDEMRVLVSKVLEYEASSAKTPGRAVLVADDPDSAGDFERDADEIGRMVLPSQDPLRIYLGRLGTEATRTAIVDAFNGEGGLVSYVGHGGIHLWASENIFDSSRVSTLDSRRDPPLVLTLNCLNGYFHFPYFNSLAEELVKAEGKGAIAVVAPSGLSLNEPAHLYHKALVGELVSGRHRRLGDALLAAQSAYAASGAFPELLRIYLLLGDPALTLR
jgi:hypothetical protein